MKVLVVTDVHSELQQVGRLKDWLIHNNEEVALVVLCGDLTHEGSVAIAEEVISGLGKIARVIAVPGNMDSKEVSGFLSVKKVGIHKKKADIQGYTFIGFGGAKPVNTYYRFNIGELEAKKYLEKLFEGVGASRAIIVSHSPPSGTKLAITGSGVDLGIDALRRVIDDKQPLACFCGHLHESAGQEMIGKTLCLNPGPLMHGNAAIVELDSLRVKKIEF